jgi:phage terminase large subunit-like protein
VGCEEEARALLRRAAALDEAALARLLKGLPAPVRRAVEEGWWARWHEGQVPEKDDWRVWLLRAGRGFGKTRAGAEWVWARARESAEARIALVGANLDDVVKVMVEGPAGLAAVARSGESARWVASRWRVDFSSGATGFAYSAERPEKLRGPEHDFAWCDELGKWARGDSTWDNLMLGLRRGEAPRAIVTTTPRPCALMRRIRALPGFTETRGRTADNRHSAADYKESAYSAYGGTRLGRQELDGELIEDVAGALWTREILERSRGTVTSDCPRVVVGVDPPASADGDACGIVVCGSGPDGRLWVLADASVEGLRPEGWARAVAAASEAWGADRVVAEKNQGGDMVESVLRSAGTYLPVRLVSASKGKAARAEPVAALFEAGKAGLAGAFPRLEDELAGITHAGGYEGPGRSPDRADAMVWAMTELIKPPPAEPRVRRL